jgi:hypothetical protein
MNGWKKLFLTTNLKPSSKIFLRVFKTKSAWLPFWMKRARSIMNDTQLLFGKKSLEELLEIVSE